jgi:putative DNA primase/helicase
MRPDVREQARGRWPGIFAALGVDDRTLSGKHGACPMCGGRDRFRFDDKEGRGTWICSRCGAGDGFKFVMLTRGVDFKGAATLVREVLPNAPEVSRAKERSIDEKRAALKRVWDDAVPVEPGDPVHRYLAARAITIVSPALRKVPSHPYYSDGRRCGSYDAMVAVIKGPDGKGRSLHVTYLQNGKKAPIETPRKCMQPVATIAGAAVWLTTPEPTLGVAEGIETALSAYQLFDVPTWAALSANGMASFLWPEVVRRLVIFADNDESFTGHKAAYTLACRAKAKGLAVEVRMPEAKDWNEVLRTKAPPAGTGASFVELADHIPFQVKGR